MKLELKNIKYAAFASEETPCYQAAVYVDGKKAVLVSNDGHGGSDHQQFKDKVTEEAITAYFAGLPKVASSFGVEFNPNLEYWCHTQVEVFNLLKTIRRLSKTSVVAFQGPDLVSWKLRKGADFANAISEVKKQSPHVMVLNGLSEAETRKIIEGVL